MSKAARVLLVAAAVAALAVGIWRDQRNERRVNFAINNLTNYIAFADGKMADLSGKFDGVNQQMADLYVKNLMTGVMLSNLADYAATESRRTDYNVKQLDFIQKLRNGSANAADFSTMRTQVRMIQSDSERQHQLDWLEAVEKQFYASRYRQ